MTTMRTAARELWGLFVDDGSLALALLLWCAAMGVLARLLPHPFEWDGPALFLGCVLILLVNVRRAAAPRRPGR